MKTTFFRTDGFRPRIVHLGQTNLSQTLTTDHSSFQPQKKTHIPARSPRVREGWGQKVSLLVAGPGQIVRLLRRTGVRRIVAEEKTLSSKIGFSPENKASAPRKLISRGGVDRRSVVAPVRSSRNGEPLEGSRIQFPGDFRLPVDFHRTRNATSHYFEFKYICA